MDLMSIVMRPPVRPLDVAARKLVATSANSSAASICAQCPQLGNTCSGRLRDQLERDHGAVERVDPVLAAPGEQRVLAELVRLAPEHAVLGGLGVPERHAHRAHRLLGAGRGGVGEPLLDQLVGDQVLVDDHRRDERAQRLAGRVGAEVHQPLDALGRVGVEQVERQPARAHQHQPADPVGVGQRQPHRRTAAEAVAEQVHLLDAQLVEQRDDVVGGEAEVVADDRRLVGAAEAGLVDEQGAEDAAKRGSAEPKLDHADAPGPPPCSITSGSPPPMPVGASGPAS